MKRFLIIAMLVALLVAPVMAHSIDYIATDIQPQWEFSGQSGHFKVVDTVAPGDSIAFMLTFELIDSAGGPTATLPLAVTFSVKNKGGPEDFGVTFGPSPGTASATYTYIKQFDKIQPFTTQVRAVAPATPGSYHFKIQANGNQAKGLQPGDGIVVHFRVADDPVTCDPPVETVLTVSEPECLVYKDPATEFAATLTAGDEPLAGKPIDFSVDGISIGSAVTDSTGRAAIAYNPGALTVGDHTVTAGFSGETAGDCTVYLPDSHSATMGVTYAFLGFQPPVRIDGIGAGLFSGKVIPVKIKIADYYGNPVTDAQARVYFTQTSQVLETQATAIQPEIADTGNLMRYDSLSDQYILNWDISSVQNGAYNIRVAMGEGEKCVVGHWVPVNIQKSGKGVKGVIAFLAGIFAR